MTGTSYIDTTKTNTETSSDSNAKISVVVYADSGTELTKNHKSEFTFKVKGIRDGHRIELQKNDYFSVTTTSKDIEIGNSHDFAIDIKKNNENTSIRIEANETKAISVTKSDHFYVSKAENKKTSSNDKISFFVYANSGTSLYINGQLDYKFEYDPITLSYRIDLKKNDYLSVKTTSKEIKVENLNDFAIDLENRVGAVYSSLIETKKRATIVVTKSDHFYVSKAEISFLVHADAGTRLYKNDELYFEFKANNSARDMAYRISLKKSDYLSVTTTSTTKTNAGNANRVNITVENTHDFTIVLQTKEEVSVEYIIEAGEKKTITALKSEKFYVSKKPGLFMKLDKGVSVYLNNASKVVYTFNGNEFICVTCKLKDDSLTVSKDTSMTVENQNIFDVQLQLKDSKKEVGENISKFSIASMHTIEKRWLKTEKLVYDKKRPSPKSPNIHIDKTVERRIPPNAKDKIKFKIYVPSEVLLEGMTLGKEIILQLTHRASKSSKAETKKIEADKLMDFEGTEDTIFQFSCSFKLDPPKPGEIDISEAVSPNIHIPILLINEQDPITEKIALTDASSHFSSSIREFLPKDHVLRDDSGNEVKGVLDLHDAIKKYIKNTSLKGIFLEWKLPFFIPRPEPSLSFQVTKNLYHKISVLNLVAKNKFYIECYEINLFKISGLKFKETIEYAGKRAADAKTNDSAGNRISKIAFAYPVYLYGDSTLWDTMFDSEDILQANTQENAETFNAFYSIMHGNIPSGAKVTMLETVRFHGEKLIHEIDRYVEVKKASEILANYKPSSALFLNEKHIGDWVTKYDVFALCLWDIKKPFVTRSSSSSGGSPTSGAEQDKTSQEVRLYITIKEGEITYYKNYKPEYTLKKDEHTNIIFIINKDNFAALEDTRIIVFNQNYFTINLQTKLHGRNTYEIQILPRKESNLILIRKGESLVFEKISKSIVTNTNTNTNTSTGYPEGSYDVFTDKRQWI